MGAKIKNMPNGFSFNFDGGVFDYAYEDIMKHVRRVEEDFPDEGTVDHLMRLASIFAKDYSLSVGIADHYQLIKGIAAIILAHLLDWFKRFAEIACGAMISASGVAFKASIKFFDWLFS